MSFVRFIRLSMSRARSRPSKFLRPLYKVTALCLCLALFCTGSLALVAKRRKAPSDEEIRAALLKRLHFVEGIKVKVQNGRVVLDGRVRSLLERSNAGEEAERTRGVVEVDNRLQVAGPARSDLQIKRDIMSALATQAWFPAHRVAVEVHGGVARLTGNVAEIKTKRLIEQMVAGVRGVKDIANDISVIELDGKASARSDDEVKWEIKSILAADLGEAAAKGISVEVVKGHATLRGTVKGFCEKSAAGQAAESVSGVSQVTNLIKVAWR